jgi:hypothetical protein
LFELGGVLGLVELLGLLEQILACSELHLKLAAGMSSTRWMLCNACQLLQTWVLSCLYAADARAFAVLLPSLLQGAFYVLPDMSAFFGPGVEAKGYGPIPDADALAMYLIQQAHVALVPGDAFGAPDCIRVSYAASMATLKEALDRLVRALQPDVFTRS